jgi:hypothetical protein
MCYKPQRCSWLHESDHDLHHRFRIVKGKGPMGNARVVKVVDESGTQGYGGLQIGGYTRDSSRFRRRRRMKAIEAVRLCNA